LVPSFSPQGFLFPRVRYSGSLFLYGPQGEIGSSSPFFLAVLSGLSRKTNIGLFFLFFCPFFLHGPWSLLRKTDFSFPFFSGEDGAAFPFLLLSALTLQLFFFCVFFFFSSYPKWAACALAVLPPFLFLFPLLPSLRKERPSHFLLCGLSSPQRTVCSHLPPVFLLEGMRELFPWKACVYCSQDQAQGPPPPRSVGIY